MTNNLDSLLAFQKKKSLSPDVKAINIHVNREVHLAFKRACSAGGVTMSKCLEAMMLDFIQHQMLKPDALKAVQFGATTERRTGT